MTASSIAILTVAAMALLGMAGFAQASTPAPVPHHEGVPAGFSPAGTPVAPGAESRLRTATFGAGCFWGVEATFRQTPGVTHTAVGYAGGKIDKPSYDQVCDGDTGHAEVVELLYDPQIITYEELLAVFWANHNPTTLNRQGPDVGTQYRSVIFYHDDEQQAAAHASKAAAGAEGKWAGREIVTQIVPAPTFYAAEDYHQQYLEKRGVTSCH